MQPLNDLKSNRTFTQRAYLPYRKLYTHYQRHKMPFNKIDTPKALTRASHNETLMSKVILAPISVL